MESTKYQQLLDAVETLPPEDQEALVDAVRQRLIEKRRKEISCNAEKTMKALNNHTAQTGTFDDLKKDLLDSV